MNPKQVGDFFRDEAGEIWKMISYCSSPTATLIKMGSTERITAATHSLIIDRFTHIDGEDAQKALETLELQLGREADELNKTKDATCPNCGAGSTYLSSKKHGQSRCYSCNWRGSYTECFR